MNDWRSFPRTRTVAERKAQAVRDVAARKKTGASLEPVRVEGRTIATTFWGRSWCDNLERYRDYANRLERGRSYLRSGSVIHLEMSRGNITALVSGSAVYKVRIAIAAMPAASWQVLAERCAGVVDSLLELLQGKLDAAVMARMCERDTGLFPSPREIELDCSCPDIATMCKHVAAVLYGVGARLDRAPELLFELRSVAAADLVAGAAAVGEGAGRKRSARRLDDEELGAMFGIELDAPPASGEIAHPVTRASSTRSAKPLTKAATMATKRAADKPPKKAVAAKKAGQASTGGRPQKQARR